MRPPQGVMCDSIGPARITVRFTKGAGLVNPQRAGSYAVSLQDPRNDSGRPAEDHPLELESAKALKARGQAADRPKVSRSAAVGAIVCLAVVAASTMRVPSAKAWQTTVRPSAQATRISHAKPRALHPRRAPDAPVVATHPAASAPRRSPSGPVAPGAAVSAGGHRDEAGGCTDDPAQRPRLDAAVGPPPGRGAGSLGAHDRCIPAGRRRRRRQRRRSHTARPPGRPGARRRFRRLLRKHRRPVRPRHDGRRGDRRARRQRPRRRRCVLDVPDHADQGAGRERQRHRNEHRATASAGRPTTART